MKMIENKSKMPGPSTPAFFRASAVVIGLAACMLAVPAIAQQSGAQQPAAQPEPSVEPPASVQPVPGGSEMSKMVWSTILAVDHANKSGNYSVLRDMSAQGFQINNNAAKLATIFAGIRESRIDLSNALLVPPTYAEAPRLLQANLFQVKGLFNLRPTAIYFDMYFQWEQGSWKLFGVDLQSQPMPTSQPLSRGSSQSAANR